MTNTLNYLETLIRETHKAEAEVMTMAFQTGLRQLWREHILGCYLRAEITRNEAIEAVGIDLVELAERQHKAMMEDLAWAMKRNEPTDYVEISQRLYDGQTIENLEEQKAIGINQEYK